jgi:hypothetical protein
MMQISARKIAGALVALGLGVAPIVTAAPAAAGDPGAAIAAGIGGFALGALAGSSARPVAPPPPYYGAPLIIPRRSMRRRRPIAAGASVARCSTNMASSSAIARPASASEAGAGSTLPPFGFYELCNHRRRRRVTAHERRGRRFGESPSLPSGLRRERRIMGVSRNPSSTRTSRILLGATVAVSLGAAIAATPSLGARSVVPASVGALGTTAMVEQATLGDSATALRPFGDGPAILIGRAYGADDEDCVLAVTRVEGSEGQVSVSRGVVCPQ